MEQLMHEFARSCFFMKVGALYTHLCIILDGVSSMLIMSDVTDSCDCFFWFTYSQDIFLCQID